MTRRESIRSTVFWSSIAMNASLVCVLVFWNPPSADSSVLEPVMSGAEAPSGGARDPALLVKKAIAAGIPEDLAYAMALQSIRPSLAHEEYWRAPIERMLRESVDRQLTDQRIRDMLTRSFGQSVRGRPELASVFQPYSRRFPFLSSEKQIALEKILSSSADQGGSLRRLVGVTCPPGACNETEKAIRALLTKDEYFEYQLRESPLAIRLTNSGFDFTEQEFRGVFRVLAQPGQPANVFEVTLPTALASQVRAVLGDQRFAQFEQLRDPTYRLLTQLAKQYSVSGTSINVAYRTIKESERKLAAIRRTSQVTEGMQTAIYQERDRALQTSLGAEVATKLARYLEPNKRTTVSNAGIMPGVRRPVAEASYVLPRPLERPN